MHIDDAEMERIVLAQQGDMQAMQALVDLHLPLIGALAARLRIPYMEKDALIQAGCMGFMQAVRRYACGRETKLTTYAVPWILGEMKRAIRRETSFCLSLDGEAESGEGSLLCTLSGSEGIDVTAVDLRMAHEKLTEDLRMVVCLRYFRDKTQKETALLLKKSQTQISRMERQALDHLHALLA